MLRDITLGQYYQADSLLHRLDCRVKLVGTLLFIISLFVVDNFPGYALAAVFLAVCIRLSKVPFRFMIKGMKAIVFLMLFAVVFNLFLTPGTPVVLAVPAAFPINEVHQAQQLAPRELGEGIALVPPERCVLLDDFAHIPYIVLHEGNYLRLCTNVMFQERRIQPNILLEVEKSSVAYNFAHFGLGATIISNMLVACYPPGDGLVYYKIRSDHAARDAFLCYRRGRYVTTAMRKIIELLTETADWRGPISRSQGEALAELVEAWT